MKRDDPNVKVLCGSCATGEHMCGGDCDCVLCFMDRMIWEDSKRLEQAIERHNIQRVLDDSHEEGWDLAARIVEQDTEIAKLQAALEDRDRLRAAAEAVYVDEAGFCHGLGKLRAALESRDG